MSELYYSDGMARQADLRVTADYGQDYWDKYVGYEGTEIARKINEARVSLVNRHIGADAKVVDVGIGSGEFIKSRPNTYGYDVNPVAEKWLKEQNKWRPDLGHYSAFTFWDVIEHVPRPKEYFDKMPVGSWVFFSLPIFKSLKDITKSKHYRPGEHLRYWTQQGFIDWMGKQGNFECVEVNDDETRAGREEILSFAFHLTNVISWKPRS